MSDYKYRNNKFNSRNYIKVLENLTPGFYIDEELSVSGQETDPFDTITHSIIDISNNSQQLFGLSAFEDSLVLGDINPSSFAKYFVKQNKLTEFDIVDFDTEILAPLGYYLNDFNSSSQFATFVSGTLLPKIQNGNPQLQTSTASAYSTTLSGTHDHLLEKMGWFYILNMSGHSSWDYAPSSYVVDKLVDTVYRGDKLETKDGIKGVINYIWRNAETSAIFEGILPGNFTSGVGTYTSGVQQLEKLETLLDILISTREIDENDTSVKESLDDYYFNGSSITWDTTPKGSFYKFLRAISWSIAGTTDQVSKLSDLYNPDTCSDQMLVRIADLLALELHGYNPDRWRLQIKNAVSTFRRTGTVAGLKAGIDSIYGKDAFDVSSKVIELYESYIPDIIVYSLITESPYFKTFSDWSRQQAYSNRIKAYSTSSLEENVRIATDYILLELYTRFPKYFTVGKGYFEPLRFETIKKSGIASDDFTGPGSDRSRIYSLIHNELTKPYSFFPTPLNDSDTYEYNYSLVHEWALRNNYTRNDIDESIHDGIDGYGFYLTGNVYDLSSRNATITLGGIGGNAGNAQIGGGNTTDTDPNSIEEGSPQNEDFLLLTEGDPNFVFNYRGHRGGFPIPPFESKAYYHTNDVNSEMITSIGDSLRLFECPTDYVNSTLDYLREGVLSQIETSGIERAFSRTLFFTTDRKYPPNYSNLVKVTKGNKIDYIPLWNAKSSHFIVDLKANTFDFAKKGITSDGAQAPANIGRVTKQISPAKAIPLIALDVSSTDLDHYYNTNFNFIDTGLVDGVLTDQITQGRNFSRSFITKGYHSREGFNMPITFHPSSTENSLPSSLGFVPLARRPAGDSYAPIRNQTDIHNLPGVWRASSTMDVDNVFYFGNPLSNTFPCRGASALGSDAKNLDISKIHDKYQDRSEFQSIMKVMHQLWDRDAEKKAAFYVRDVINNEASGIDNFAWNLRNKWKYVAKSYANEAVHSDCFPTLEGPSSIDYDNFEFSPGIYEIYNYYIANFGAHDLGKNILFKADAGIISQTYGPLLYNANLSVEGSAVAAYPYTQASEYTPESVFKIDKRDGSGVLGTSGLSYWETTLVPGTNPTEMPVPISGTLNPGNDPAGVPLNVLADVNEFRNPHFCSGIELVDTSGASDGNNFQLFNRPNNLVTRNVSERHVGGNTVIKCKAINGLPRLRFNLKDYGNISTGNILLPEHELSLNLSALIAEESGRSIGGGSIGVWIHTESIPDATGERFFWSWVQSRNGGLGSWLPTRLSSLSKNLVVVGAANSPPLANIFNLDEVSLTDETAGTVLPLGSLSGLGPVGSTNFPHSLNLIEKSFFKPLMMGFTTKYSDVEHPEIIPAPVHTDSREYFVEIFLVPRPSNETKYMLFDRINVRDNTLYNAASISAGVPEDPSRPFEAGRNESVVQLSKEELWTIIRYLKQSTENMNSTLTRNQTTRSRGLWIHDLVTNGANTNTTFVN